MNGGAVIGGVYGGSTSQDYCFPNENAYNIALMSPNNFYIYKMSNLATGVYTTYQNYQGNYPIRNPYLCPSDNTSDGINMIANYNGNNPLGSFKFEVDLTGKQTTFGFFDFQGVSFNENIKPLCLPSTSKRLGIIPFSSKLGYAPAGFTYFIDYVSFGFLPIYTFSDGKYIVVIDEQSNFFTFILNNDVTAYSQTYTNDPSSCTSTNRKSGIVDNGIFYSTCGNKLQVFNLTTTPISLVTTYSNIWASGWASNSGYDKKLGQLFFTVYNPADNSFKLATITTDGKKPQLLDINEIYTNPNSNFYPIGVYNINGNQKIFIPTPSGTIIDVSYTSLCPNNCGGPTLGTCYQATCTCTYFSFSDDCTKYILSVDPIQYLSPITITLVGAGFSSIATDYTGSNFLSIPLVNFTYVSSNKIIFSIPQNELVAQNPSPFANHSLNFVFSGNTYVYNNVQFATPSISGGSNIDYSPTAFTIVGSNFHPSSYMSVSLSGINQTCTFQQKSIICPFGSDTKSGSLVVQAVPTGTSYLAKNVFFIPLLQSITPSIFPSPSTLVTLNAYLLGTIPVNYIVKVLQGTVYLDTNSITSNTITFYTLNNITTTNTLKIYITPGDYNSGSLAYSYLPPTITSYSQSNPTNNYVINGDNFGTTASLVEFNSSVISIASINHSKIVITLSTSVVPPLTVSVKVASQTSATLLDINPGPVITSFGEPSVVGSTLSVSGEFLFGAVVTMTNKNSTSISLSCSNIGTINYPSTISCVIPPGSGNFNVTASKEYKGITAKSPIYSTSYQKPTISSVSPNKYFQNRNTSITIQGTNFANQSAVVILFNTACTIFQINSTTIQCSILPTETPNISLNPVIARVSIDGLSSNNLAGINYLFSCLNDCGGFGVCNNSIGVCICNTMHSGDDCSIFDCPKNCSNHGICNTSNGICACDNLWKTQDCSIPQANITGMDVVPMLFQGNLNITGINFQNTILKMFDDGGQVNVYYTIKSNTNISIESFGSDLISSTVAIEFYYNSTLISETYYYNFTKPTLSGISQYIDSSSVYLKIIIQDTYSPDFSQILYGTNEQVYENSVNGTFATFKIKIGDQSGSSYHSDYISFIGFPESSNVQIFRQFYTIHPMITDIAPDVFNTSPTKVTLTGYLFNSTINTPPILIQGSVSTQLPAQNVTYDQIIFTSYDGINPDLQVSLKIGDVISSIGFSYAEPTIEEVDQHDNSISIYGNNFGKDSEYTVLTTKGNNIITKQTIISIDHNLIISVLTDNVTNGVIEVTVLDQSSADTLILSPNVKSLGIYPLTTDTNITLIGNYLRDTTIYYAISDNDEIEIDCAIITQSDSNYNITLGCGIPSGSGEFIIRVANNDDLDVYQLKTLHYHEPILTSMNPNNYKHNSHVNFTITGNSFINDSQLVSVLIQDEQCEIISVDYTEIQCSLTSTLSKISNPIKVNVTVNGISTVQTNLVQIEMECLNNCSEKGTCDKTNGKCTCNEGLDGDDCSLIKEISVSSKQFNFNLSLIFLSLILLIIC